LAGSFGTVFLCMEQRTVYLSENIVLVLSISIYDEMNIKAEFKSGSSTERSSQTLDNGLE
jgi:hypothetical protein